MSYFMNLALAIDRLGNALCAGNSEATISGRCGYLSNIHSHKSKSVWRFWRSLESVIDFAFKPVDGLHHCYGAYACEAKRGVDHKTGNDLARAGLALLVIPVCLLIAVGLRVYDFIK